MDDSQRIDRKTNRFVPPAEHRLYPWIAALAVAVMLVRCMSTTRHFNHTWDEPYHIGAAVALYEAKRHVVDVSHPPLPWMVAAVPLRLAGVEAPELRSVKAAKMLQDSWQPGRDVLFADGARNYWRILTGARAAMLIFPVIVCLYLFLLARWLASGLVAMFAVMFFCTDPTILGHAALVNNDVAAAAGFMAAMYHGLRWIVSPSWPRAAGAGLAIGLALACKFTAMLIIPSLGLIALVRPLSVFVSRIQSSKVRVYFRRLPSIWQIVACAAIGFVALWSTYFFQINSLSKEVFYTWSPQLTKRLEPIKHIPIPMPGFFQGVAFQMAHSRHGHPTYLNGVFQNPGKGWWYYFPEALAIKEPTGVVIGLLGAVALAMLVKPRRPWRLLVILVPLAAYLVFAMKGGVMIGVRHLIPILPLLYLFIAFEFVRLRAGIIVLSILLLASYAETAWRHPDYLAFFNVAVGGPTRGDRYLLDSNLDWGQDVYRLAEWLKSPEAPRGPVTTRLYGLATMKLLKALGIDAAGVEAEPQGIFVISESVKHGFKPERRDQDYEKAYVMPDYSWLPQDRLIKRIGYSIEVYDLRGVTTRPAPADATP